MKISVPGTKAPRTCAMIVLLSICWISRTICVLSYSNNRSSSPLSEIGGMSRLVAREPPPVKLFATVRQLEASGRLVAIVADMTRVEQLTVVAEGSRAASRQFPKTVVFITYSKDIFHYFSFLALATSCFHNVQFLSHPCWRSNQTSTSITSSSCLLCNHWWIVCYYNLSIYFIFWSLAVMITGISILFWDVIVGNLDVPSSYQEKRGHLSIWDTHVHYAYIMLLVLFYLCFWLLHVFTNYVSLIIQFCPETLISSLLEVTCSLKLHLHEFAQTWF